MSKLDNIEIPGILIARLAVCKVWSNGQLVKNCLSGSCIGIEATLIM